MTKFVYAFTEGNKDQKDLLGGKGANLAHMTRLGLPVPPGFTISTDACRYYLEHGEIPTELEAQIDAGIASMEAELGRKLGDAKNPLLVSVRSGAKFSMPGMMETVLNVGLNDETVHGLAGTATDPSDHGRNERFAYDSYRRLLQMFGKTVLNLDGDLFEDALEAAKRQRGLTSDTELDAAALQELITQYKEIIRRETGKDFPQDPREQLKMSTLAVFESWNGDRARIYRNQERIPHDLGTAVNICAMVFGNRDDQSATGVGFTRDPATGDRGVYGDFLMNAQGEDVVAGIRNTLPLPALGEHLPEAYAELTQIMQTLEEHYRDLCDIEFTVESGKLWMLQTRVGKRTAAAAFQIASHLIDEGVITEEEALLRVDGAQLSQLMFPRFADKSQAQLLAQGMNASPGAAVGKVVFDSASAVAAAEKGEKVILIRKETNPDDLEGMVVSAGIVTSRGGKTSHAAVVARGMGRTCVCGVEEFDVDQKMREIRVNGEVLLREGDLVSIDGGTGEVFLGEVPVAPSEVVQYFEGDLDPDSADASELVRAVHRLMQIADKHRRLHVHANADNAEDATRARKMGAEGIGLCRTEHMFLGDRRVLVEKLILAQNQEERDEALAALLPLQRGDFIEMLEAMQSRPVTIRLLDPPLHEFLPNLTELSVDLAKRGESAITEYDRKVLAAVERMHEQNPMLGLRGVRLGLTIPGLFGMQTRAILEAQAYHLAQGHTPHVEIMVPLVASIRELREIKKELLAVAAEVSAETGQTLNPKIGTMIELPRAALRADEIAEEAEFFSFGTNDLTQTTWGFSRDDVEAGFFFTYKERGILLLSPFETLDQYGVGELVRIAAERGRSTRPDITLGVCGEHGGDPASIHFFNWVGLSYVSCSPFRVPVARLEAGRAALTVDEFVPQH